VLLVPEHTVPQAPDGAYWVHQVVGLEVVTEAGRSLGRVAEVLHNPANDIWVTRGPETEVLVPALRDLVLDVDLAAGRIVVREVEGLTASDPQEAR
jgi:16S rRNA processing protein RimM